jgi:uncharacterized protein (DUF362 family)
VIIGEGPNYYQPESHFKKCFTEPGISDVADRLGIEWVIFDEHKFRTFRGISGATPDEFRVTEFAFTCDKLINVPVLKTHYQATVTLAMKNLKGCLKREDKPRFHSKNLDGAIVELNKIVRPSLNIIDATAKNLGGIGASYQGQPIGARLLLISTDAVAVDAAGCALMGIDPTDVPTVTLGAAAGLGESNLTRIEIIGEELKQFNFKVKLPQEQLRQSFPHLEITGTDRACSGCLIPLLSNLLMLSDLNAKLEKPLRICVGTKPDIPGDRNCLLIGDCAIAEEEKEINCIAGCPPTREEIRQRLMPYFS